jgi:hypothetical protein
MSAALIAGLVGAGVGLGKAVIGGVQAAKGRKQLNSLLANRPQYNIPEEYMRSLGVYQNLASQEMPGMQRYEEMIGQSTARTMTGAERGAISSNVYQGAVEQSQDRELQALQQLAQMGVQYKTQAMQNLAGAYNTVGGLRDQQFEYNVNRPWEIQANMAAGKQTTGTENLYGGFTDIGEAAITFMGTKYAQEMGGGGGGRKGRKGKGYTSVGPGE